MDATCRQVHKAYGMGQGLFISTISDMAEQCARKYGLGLEISEFCTAYNMDMDFPKWDVKVKAELQGIDKRIFHAPFNELCPGAIDPLVVEVAKKRFSQAFCLSQTYGMDRMVIHAGHIPAIYYDVWFVEKSINFWKEFLYNKPENIKIMLENVLEVSPEPLVRIVQGVDDPRLGLCLDIGHVNVNSKLSIYKWIAEEQPYLMHIHLHDNDGLFDRHMELGEGSMPISDILKSLGECCINATYTIETMYPEKSVKWLIENSFLKEGN